MIGLSALLLPAFVGIGLAIGVAVFAYLSGFDRDGAFYPTVLIVIASFYSLFALIAGGQGELFPEMLILALFVSAAVRGFKTSQWIVVAALAMHGVFDFFHNFWLTGSGVPGWWPSFCLYYDVTAATALAAVLVRREHGLNGSRKAA